MRYEVFNHFSSLRVKPEVFFLPSFDFVMVILDKEIRDGSVELAMILLEGSGQSSVSVLLKYCSMEDAGAALKAAKTCTCFLSNLHCPAQ